MLVLRGAPVCAEYFRVPSWAGNYATLRDDRRRLLAWAETALETRNIFVALVLGCGVHGSQDLPPAQRSQLLRLRGDGNTDARMRIAQCLGVRTSVAELRRLRNAAAVWTQMEEERDSEQKGLHGHFYVDKSGEMRTEEGERG